ncbi:hypothetical protein [Spongiactinospora sp. TRM90649]|uniref:hypothetical protein n=1 Tax=Spongiactinospora sp. TRM90649 TaxID=3031114 RepID=UPI0023F7BDD5|nr:hypothetical protein [Spongiactinospora sp. TRM90649]MDF5756239.1 hypothetical protein [Spongiactinospora sp. TRM90649]
MDRTFIVGDVSGYRVHRSAWWWGFVLVNCATAAVVYFGLAAVPAFRDWNSWLFAAGIGVSYLALVRLKFATVSYQNTQIPVGLDTFYESGRQFVFKRINEAVKADRARLARRLIEDHDVKSLGNQIRLDINLDALLTPEEKKTRLAWLLKVLQDPGFDEEQKKTTMAVYLASGTQV